MTSLTGSTTARRRSSAALVGALCLALSACAGGSSQEETAAVPATIGQAEVSTTDPTVTPSESAVDESEEEASADSVVEPSQPPADALPPSAGPEFTFLLGQASDGFLGSGCTPQTDWLPNGTWFGSIAEFGDGFIQFDLKCTQWVDAGGYDVQEVTNSNPKLRSVPVASNAVVSVNYDGYQQGADPALWWDEFVPQYGSYPLYAQDVWIEVIDGQLVRLEVPFSS